MATLVAALLVMIGGGVVAQTPASPPPAAVTAAELAAAIDTLGSFDFPVRSAASRTVRRADAALAAPALARAVREQHNSYVQFRALVLLAGIGGPTVGDVMRGAMDDTNDRLRAVAYTWFEHHPSGDVLPHLIDALAREQSEFVRPALTRAIAASGRDPRAERALLPLVTSGQDYFRGEVIQALGDYQDTFALDAILGVAQLDGPLQEDAALAAGKLGGKAVVPALAQVQRTAPAAHQPAIAAAICLAGVNCPTHEAYLIQTLKFGVANAEYQPLLRGAAHGLAMLATSGDRAAAMALFDAGAPAVEPSRSPIALSVGLVALRDPALMLDVLEARPDRDASIDLVRDAFDMLEEDFAEEQFYVAVRRAYWAAAADSPRRALAARLIEKLEF